MSELTREEMSSELERLEINWGKDIDDRFISELEKRFNYLTKERWRKVVDWLLENSRYLPKMHNYLDASRAITQFVSKTQKEEVPLIEKEESDQYCITAIKGGTMLWGNGHKQQFPGMGLQALARIEELVAKGETEFRPAVLAALADQKQVVANAQGEKPKNG